ncbi:MAG: ATP-dependent Clp protease ATP-binding subunit [Candidatus Nealsonbacteria bacterium]|nr:ATP-dependent Clp protease ATP-binding subunit [Candidatus Nealsonbacteria bacterium]
MFNLKEAKIYQAVEFEKFFKLVSILKKIFWFLFFIAIFLFFYRLFAPLFLGFAPINFLGFSLIFFTLAISFTLKLNFFESKLKNPKTGISLDKLILKPQEYNLAEFLSFEVAKAIDRAIKATEKEKIKEINSSLFFYFLLVDNPKLNFIFYRLLLDLKMIKETLFVYLKSLKNLTGTKNLKPILSLDFQEILLESLKIANIKNHQRIEIGDILTALAKKDLIFQKILIDADLKVPDIENSVWWLEFLENKIEEEKKWWEWQNLRKKGSLAKDWAAGYTVLLDQFSIDMTKLMRKQKFRAIFAHQAKVEEMETILSKIEKNNVLIIGEPGSGRRSMIESLANKCALGNSLPELNYNRVVILDLAKILNVSQDIKETERILDKILSEVVYAGNIILVIDNLDNYIGVLTERKLGIMDISGILSPYLASPFFRFVGITALEGFHKNIEKNSSFLALFEKIEVSEISEKETLLILEERALKLEMKYRVLISYLALRDIIFLSSKYLPAFPFPEKAINLLDEAVVYLARKKKKILLPKDIAEIITEKTQIPVGEVEIKEREILLNLEELIHQKIINQEEAVKEVSSALRRARAQVTIKKGPMGCFLFLGPTGVGKTETAKALAEIYFGSKEKMIRFDMSEFQLLADISRLIGSETQEGLLTTKIKDSPFSLILLDEIEKAHPNILNLFLQVLDEGHLTDNLGRKVNFKNSIIIATSNAGYQIILESFKEKINWSECKAKLIDYLFKEGIFRPEFLNRFDGVILFQPLTKENLLIIAELLLGELKKNLKEKNIDFIITPGLKEKIIELGYNPIFGAREMKRVIQDKIENVLALAILSHQLKRGNRAEIDPQNFKLKINS